ncbi:hypothetical protein [uncultured Pseudomonas sp.]|uniref:hypothetical protein n=1 Tax=uncultured Pseudomonas sp. TaxID=114707 RepID=UPI00262D1166|nr:hypothetical protein [uncultured Pseudomonas sp.]
MPHAHRQNHDDLSDALDDVAAVIDELSFNVQDDHWLVYCALGGHEHYALADLDTRPDLNLPTLYSDAA